MKSFFSVLLLLLLSPSLQAMQESMELNQSQINLIHYVELYPPKTVLTGKDVGNTKTATLNENGEILIWNTKTGALIKTLEGTYKDRKILSLYIGNNGHDLFVRTDTESFTVVISEKKLGGKGADIILTGHDSTNTKTATLDQSGWIQVWDNKTKELLHILTTNYKNTEVHSFFISDDGKWITIETFHYQEKVMLNPLSSKLIVEDDYSIITPKNNVIDDRTDSVFSEEEQKSPYSDKGTQELSCSIQ
ncbi:hypothetical protein H0X06_02440 [Candidatus Dependentiae bacterium]|nr:hypothetical protein [Candidatus Dependentiae bacterium]